MLCVGHFSFFKAITQLTIEAIRSNMPSHKLHSMVCEIFKSTTENLCSVITSYIEQQRRNGLSLCSNCTIRLRKFESVG